MPSAVATRDHHPSKIGRSRSKPARTAAPIESVTIPKNEKTVELPIAGRTVTLTNLGKPFWPELGITKGDLIQYYADVAPVLLPHLRDRAMVMKRYPHGAHGEFFFMKRAPTPRPEWIQTCSIEHESENIIDFPMIQDLPSLLWCVNLGCIDLNPWYARCDDVDRPDYLHFDLDPVSPVKGGKSVPFARVLEVALILREALDHLGMPSYPKTTGSRGIHVYVPIVRGPTQKQVWTFAKAFAQTMAKQATAIITAEYKIAKRPQGRVLVDYNQNAWGRTLSSVYSVRPKPLAPVSMPVTWKEIEKGITIEQFTLVNARQRIKKVGDLWTPLLPDQKPRVDLMKVMT
ncbi:MAG: bifunctional non-ous end joining protein LigD [Humisphaera sp.]|nr:bifunctional non-ous end joining protein LigD [Humisphaera sp.]